MSETLIRVKDDESYGWAVHTFDGEWYKVEWDDGFEDDPYTLWRIANSEYEYESSVDFVLRVVEVNGL